MELRVREASWRVERCPKLRLPGSRSRHVAAPDAPRTAATLSAWEIRRLLFLELTALCRYSGSQRARSVCFWPLPTMARETSRVTALVKGHPAPHAPRFLQAKVHLPALAPETQDCASTFACIPAVTQGNHGAPIWRGSYPPARGPGGKSTPARGGQPESRIVGSSGIASGFLRPPSYRKSASLAEACA
jgi:hypothetical protein